MATELVLDISDLQRKIDELKDNMTVDAFHLLMKRSIVDASKHAKVTVAKEAYKDYAVTQRWIKSNIYSPRISENFAGGVQAVIPISGHRGSIGGTFKMGKWKRNKQLKAKILRSGMSTLPERFPHQGNNKGFVIDGIAYTRSDRNKRVRVVGVSVPQMPLNKSRQAIEESVLDYMGKRMEHYFMRYMQGKL